MQDFDPKEAVLGRELNPACFLYCVDCTFWIFQMVLGEGNLESSFTVCFNVKTVCRSANSEDSWPSVYRLDLPCSAWPRCLVFLWGLLESLQVCHSGIHWATAAANQQGNSANRYLTELCLPPTNLAHSVPSACPATPRRVFVKYPSKVPQ